MGEIKAMAIERPEKYLALSDKFKVMVTIDGIEWGEIRDLTAEHATSLAERITDYEKVKAERDEAMGLLRQAKEKIVVVSPLWRIIGEFLSALDAKKEASGG